MSPKRATESASGFRRYRWEGKEYTSVTTILSNGIPKPALMYWAAKCVAEYVVSNIPKVTEMAAEDPDAAIQWIKGAHYRAKKSAGLKGTELHNLAEAHAKGEPLPPVAAGSQGYVKSLMEFLDDFAPDPILIEETTYSIAHGYAGTFDSIAKFDKLGTCILDWKTGKSCYPEVGLQLSAYTHSDGYDDGSRTLAPLPAMDGALVVHITPGGYAVFKVDAGDETFEYFLAAQKVAHFAQDYGKTVLSGL